MKTKGVINQLKKLNENEFVKVILTMVKYGLKENCSHVGEWNGIGFYCKTTTNWRSGELFTDSMTVKDLIELFEAKNLEELKESDFIDLNLVESNGGETTFKEIVWDTPLTEAQEEELEVMDLYWDSEITDGNFEFDFNSIESIKIEGGNNLIINL